MEELPIASDLNEPEFRVDFLEYLQLFPESSDPERGIFEAILDFLSSGHEDLVISSKLTSSGSFEAENSRQFPSYS